MNLKLYISTLVLIFALLGLGKQHITIPNQEIVVKFAYTSPSLSETQHAIARIETQLRHIGASDIKVHSNVQGELKISYYSAVHVSKVQQLLSGNVQQEFSLNLQHSEKQSQNESSDSYNLDVYEIKQSSDSEIDFEGHVVELKVESDRYFTPSVFTLTSEINNKVNNNTEAVAYNLYGNLALTIDTWSYQTPEVRAGPCIL
ncbi:MAG: hypothetical protein HRT67_12265 [Flavobacteriaceae bacterium]|nr:hypothetical protein [Flavobacteriaceae bacterium]